MDDIGAWLEGVGLGQYAEQFRAHDLGFDVLGDLTDDDLKELGVSSGHRRLLLQAINALAEGSATMPVAGDSPAATPSPPPSAAERRQLTVLFCDLVGANEPAARLDPAETREVIAAYRSACSAVVRRFDGHVARSIGDGVMAYFGWPRAHEDDAERAVRAGLDMAEAVGRIARSEGPPLAARVGIATGVVMVGNRIGEGAAQDVVGATPVLAARLQELAEPSAVVIAWTTRRLLGDLFELTDLGERELEGFAESIQAWRVVGASRSESRFEAFHGHKLTALVGREHEIGLLAERWERAKDGEGQVVLLSGEPGIGKSRIVRALRERLADPHPLTLSHYCSPYHTNTALYPIIAHLERAAGFARDDGAAVRLEKLEALLALGTEALAEAVPLVAALLGIASGGRYQAPALSPQRQKQRTLEVLVDQVAGLAARQPVLAVYEDAHWMDPTTLEGLGMLIGRLRRLPVLVLITFRPEFRPPWTGHAHVTQLSLSRLARRHGQALVEEVTGGKALPPEVLDQIVAKTDGVPLFVEELTKAVLESGLLADAGDHFALTGPLAPFAIPATLRDSLMARLDRLTSVREVAQIGAVIGREFAHELVAAISPLRENELAAALDQLVASELIFRRGAPPDATYTFKHTLVQDAAYQSLLKSKRQQLHARIARALARDFPSAAEHQPEVLAHHFTLGGLAQQAICYWQLAGELSARSYANVEAIAHLTKGLELTRTLPPSVERDRQELDLLTLLGPLLAAAKGYSAGEVETTYLRAQELCRDVGDARQLFQIVFGLRSYHEFRGELRKARAAAERCLGLAQELRDPELLVASYRAIGGNAHRLGEFAAACAHLEQSVGIGSSQERQPDPVRNLADARAVAHVYLSRTLGPLGYPDQALRTSDEALAMAERLAHPYTSAEILHFASGVRLLLRDPAGARRLAERLIALCREHGFGLHLAHGMLWRGWAVAHELRSGDGIKEIRASLTQFMAIGSTISHTHGLIILADAHRALHQGAKGLAALNEAEAAIGTSDERRHDAEVHRLRGELILLLPDRDQAEACFRSAIKVAAAQQAKLWELRATISLARLWADQGRRRDAADLLSPVYAWFTEGFNTADLKDAKALLEELR
ncbi:MAG TPA: AAA family ATPase [Geminicoccaceae bacterium]|nr:AAA family ATPase [Geminicoccaceae bacterium]